MVEDLVRKTKDRLLGASPSSPAGNSDFTGTLAQRTKARILKDKFAPVQSSNKAQTLKTSVLNMAKERGASSEDDFNSVVADVLRSGEYDDILDQIKADRPKDQDAVAARKAQNDGISYLADWYQEYASTLPKTSEEPKEKKNVLPQLKEAWDGFQAGKDIQRIDGIPVNNYAWGDSTGDKEREQIRGILKNHGILSTQNREGFAVPAVKDSAEADELYRDLIREGYSDDNIRRVFNDYNLGDSYKDIRSRNDDLFAEEEARANALENNIRNKIKYTRAGENLLAELDDADEVVADLVKEGYSEEEISTAFAKNNIGHLFKTQKQAETDRRADALTEKLNGTEDLGTFRDAAKSVGYSDFEVDNALRRSGNGSLVSEDDQLKHYVFELLGNSATDEQKELFFQSLSQEDKATYSAQMAFDPNVNTDGWMDQLGRTALSVPFNAAAGVLSGYAGFLDMLADNSVTASLVEDINADAARWQALGNDRGSTGNTLISLGGQVTSELLRMYAVSATGEAFGGFAASKGLNKMLVSGAKAMPFVSSSMGSYYREAVESGADRGEAVAYGVVAGTIEGSLEKLGTDEIFSKVLSTKAFKAVPAIKSILHSKAGQKLAHAAVAALSEGLEEGASYVLTGLAQRAIYNPNWSFDSSEFWENAGMGALVGTFGSILTRYPALTDPNADPLERERAIQELDERLSGLYDEQGKLNAKEFDSAVFEAQVAAMPETKVETRLPEAMLLTQDEYREAQSQVYKATAEINAAKEVYDQANASIDSEVTKAQKQFDKADKAFFAVHEQWKMAADPAVKAKLTERLSLLAKQRSEARAKLARTNASAKSKREQTQREYEAATAKDVAARNLNQRLLDDHAIADGEHRKVAIAGRAMDLLSLEYERLLEQANRLGQRMQTEADGTTLDQLGANYDEIIREIQTLREDIGATAEQQMEAESRNNAAHAAWEEQRVRREELAKNLDNLMNEQSANRAKAQAEAEARKAVEAERERVQLAIAEAEARKANIERNERDLDKIEAIAWERGLNVKLTNDLSVGRNGKYEDGVLYINSASEDPYFVTFKHEITHHIENSKYYGRYQKIVLDNVEKSCKEMGMQGDVLGQLVEAKKAEYAEDGITLDDEKAKREIVASWTQSNLFEDGNAIDFLAKTEPGLFHTVYNYLQSTISKIGEDDVTKSLIEAERLFGRAVNTAKGGSSAGRTMRSDKATSDNGEKYSLNPKFAQEYDAWDKVNTRGYFVVGDTSEPLQAIGIEPKNIEWDKSKIVKIKEKHPGMTDSVIKQVPNILEYPVIIMRSKQADSRIVLFGEVFDENNVPVLAVLELQPTINQKFDLNVIKIASAYGKDTNPQKLINESDILYVDPDKNRTDRWLEGTRLQLPFVLKNYGSINKIAYSDATVNPSIRKNGEKDAQTSAEEASFSLGLPLEELVKKYGLIPEGENPAREANIPQQIDDATRVSRFIRTVAEAGNVSEEVAQAAREKVAEGLGSYTPISNAEAIKYAQQRIAERGLSGALNVWKDKLSDERAPSKNDIALGEQLLTEFSKAGDITTCEELIADLSMQASRAGQVTQAFSLLKRMSPAGALYHVESMAKQINKEHKKQIDTGKMKPVEVPDSLKKQLIQARNGNEVQEIKNDIAIALGEQIPATIGDKINAWRYLAMLGNPRTHVRNTLGNAVMFATRRAKDSVGSVMELKLEKGKRTKSIVVGKEYKDYARRMYKEYAGAMSGNKEGFLDAAERSRKVLPGALDKLSKFNSNKLEASDASWKKHTFVSAFAQAMKARGLTESTITPQQRGEIAAYAINEAMKATFQDASSIAAALNRMEKTGKISKVLVGGILPFKKTPINILKRGVEYSPIGLIKGVSDKIRGVKSGKDAAQVIDEIASGLTGTALTAVGMLLSSMGVLRGGGEEDDDVEYYLSDTGKQKYSLNVGGVSYTLDWLSPVAMPLFVGVNLQEIRDRGGIDEINYGAMVDAMGSIADPLTEMSLLQGLNDVLSNNQNGVGGAMWNAGSTMLQNYASQFVPTIFGQFTRAFVDDTRRSTSGDPNAKWGAGIDRAINKVENKIPGVSNTLEPYVDKWGNEQKETSWMVRILENFVSPGYLSVESDSALDTEITRLYYSTGDRDVIPTRPNRYLTQGGVRYTMTNAEYTQYQKAVGTACREAVDRIIAGWSYRTADDLEKAEMVSEAIKDAEAEVRAEFKEKLMGGD